MTTKKIILNIVASVLILAIGGGIVKFFLTSAPKAEKQKPSTSGLLIETTTLKPRDYDVIVTSVGTVEAAQKTTLSAKVSGKIIRTNPSFIPGGIVKKGDILAQVDPSDYEASLSQIKAQLSSAKASLQIELGQQASALKELELSGINAQGLNRSLMLREPQLAQAKATVENLEASLIIAQNNVRESAITAPYTGVITKKSAELGSFITSQSSVAEMVSTDAFWVYTTIPTPYFGFLETLSAKELFALEVVLERHGKPLLLKANIIKLLPELDAITKQARLIVAISDPLGLQRSKELAPQTLLLGDTLHVKIKAKHFDAILALPAPFLRANNTVWVMNAEQKLSIKPVEVLIKDDHYAIISKGLAPEDKIITTYLSTAVEGMDVVDIAHIKKAKKGE